MVVVLPRTQLAVNEEVTTTGSVYFVALVAPKVALKLPVDSNSKVKIAAGIMFFYKS
jgi:ABC-type enterobactin transport system permease subunit